MGESGDTSTEDSGADCASEAARQHRLALKKALDLLARRDHAASEIQHKLRSRGFGNTVIDGVLDYLFDKHYLDDLRFAQSFVQMRADKGYGERDIRARLAQRGVGRADIQMAFAGFDTDWKQRAAAALERKFRAVAVEEGAQWRHKAARFLHSRGFDAEQSRYAVERLTAASSGDEYKQ